MSRFKNTKIIDISPCIDSHLAVFPGDQAYEATTVLDFASGDNLKLSKILTTVHLGAHADAPNHYSPLGGGIETRPLHYYLGPCQVITCTQGENGRIYPKNVQQQIKAPRVLFRTLSFLNPSQWTNDFLALSPELISWLNEQNVLLVGIDTPSIDPAQSKELETHNMVFKFGMAVLEGLLLEHVADATYELIALPLPLKDLDASPVRAVLLDDTN